MSETKPSNEQSNEDPQFSQKHFGAALKRGI